jgi:tetratricopeptide (TPR) repeat protein
VSSGLDDPTSVVPLELRTPRRVEGATHESLLTTAARPPQVSRTSATEQDPDELEMRNRLRGALFGEPTVAVKIGRYVVLEKIGSGGLGVVYAAYDPELDRRVGLKLINPQRLSAEAGVRMQREAQAMARVAHPNVITVHDVGSHGEGTFIAMELVDGVTLGRWVRETSPPWQRIRDVLVAAGHGLSAAHEQGLVHRDFKPANVLVDRQERARVLDFGLARAGAEGEVPIEVSASSLLDVDLTQSGTVLGTPAYMAPEQFEGRSDARSDQWSFCVTAYEALFGRRPFAAGTYEELRAAVKARGIASEPTDGTVPAWLHRALRKGLEVDPDARYPSMLELLAALERDKRSRRKQWWGLAGALALSLATAGATAVFMQPAPSQEARARVDRLEEDARAAALAGRYVYPPADAPDATTAWGSVLALEHLDGPVASEAQARAETLRQEFAATLVSLGDAYWSRDGGMPFAADFYGAALVFAPDHPRARERSTLTPGEIATIRLRATQRDFSKAELVGAEPLAILTQPDDDARARRVAAMFASDDPPAASTSIHLERLLGGEVQRSIEAVGSKQSDDASSETDSSVREPGNAETPEKDTASRKADAGSRSATRDPVAARSQIEAGRAALAAGRYAEAEQAFHRALDKDGGNPAALSGLSNLYFERSAYQKALRYAKKAVAVAPKNAAFRMQLGDALFKVHRYAEARREYEEAKKIGHDNAQSALDRIDRRLGSVD